MANSRAKPKAGGTSRVGKPRKSAAARHDAGTQRAAGKAASRLIDERIRSLGDWRGRTLAEVRRIIHEADPDVVEEWKWMGTPVWSHAGNICTGESYQQVVKLTFARGASLEDPRRLFNSSLEGNTRRAIDIREGEEVDAEGLRALIRAAVAENLRSGAGKSKSQAKPGVKARPAKRGAKKA
jgi:hypothetical protein